MMIINRYIITEFLKPLFFSAAVFGILVLISEFFRELSFYLEHKTSFLMVFIYLFLNLPWWIIQVLPVAVLLAVLFSLGQLAKRNEITALKAAGVNLWRIMGILFICAGVIGAAEIALREYVIPLTVQKAEYIRNDRIRGQKKDRRIEYWNLVVSLPPSGRMTIGYLNADTNVMQNVVIDYFDPSFAPARQVVARRATWENGTWTLREGVDRRFNTDGTILDERPIDQEVVSFAFTPADFILVKPRPEQMTSHEFIVYIRQLDTLGIPSEKERIQFHLRWSSVFSYFIVMLIGIPFALGLGSRHGKFISFTFALIFAFVYWGVQAVGQSLGENKVLSPLAAAWLGNVLFGIVGMYLVSKIHK